MLRQLTHHVARPVLFTSIARPRSRITTDLILNTLTRPVSLSLVRGYVERRLSRTIAETRLQKDFGIVDLYIPPGPANAPKFRTFKKWYRVKWRNFFNGFKNSLNIGIIKYRSEYEKWNSKKFRGMAVETYIDMNDAFARDDRDELKEICLDPIYSALKSQLKERKGLKWEWRFHGLVEPARMVCVRSIGAGVSRNSGIAVGQITVRLHSKQSIAVYDGKGKLVGGNPKEIKEVLEWIVFQRILTDKNDLWRVYGKVQETEQRFDKISWSRWWRKQFRRLRRTDK